MRTYDFVLRGDTGRYDKGSVLSFPSVTTIISAVYAKPQLVGWTYNMTLDAIAYGLKLVEARYDGTDESLGNAAFRQDLMDIFADHETLDEWIRESGIHYEDFTREAQERGTAAHELLKGLVGMWRISPARAASFAARTLKASKDPHKRSVAGWWLEAEPVPTLSEHAVVHLGLRYAGRLDLGVSGVKLPPNQNPQAYFGGIIDLKTRRAELTKTPHKSDEMQTGLYKLAAVDMGLIPPDTGTAVLLAGDDGAPANLVATWVPDEAAIKIVELYWLLRKTDANGRKVR